MKLKSRQLNVTPEIYDFWTKINENFINEINQIKKDLLLKALNEDKTRQEAIEIAGLTPKEYNDLVKVSEFHNDEFSQKRNVQVETRKQRFIEYIKNNDVETSCNLAKITVEDFYIWYDKDMSSDFYLQTTKILMHNFLNQRRKGKSKVEAAQAIKLECKHVFRWFNRTLDICEKFKNEHIRVTVDLCYQGFKNNKSKKEIAQTADIKLSRLNTYLNLGQRNYGTYKLLYDYYEENIIPKQLSKFLEEIKNKAFKKALEMSELSEEEFKRFYDLGKSGDIKYQEFYYDLSNIKLNTFLKNINKGKTKERALKNSNLTGDELDEFYNMGKNNHEKFRDFYRKFYGIKLKIYIANINRGVEKTKALKNSYLDSDELKEDIDDIILNKNLYNVIKSLLNESTTKLAAKTAGIKIEEIYDWYLKGKSGDEKFSDFADYYYQCYILPGSLMIQNMLREGLPLKHILKKFKKTFTREDYNFWAKHSFLMEANEKLDEVEDEEALIEEILDKSKEYEEKNKNKLLNH